MDPSSSSDSSSSLSSTSENISTFPANRNSSKSVSNRKRQTVTLDAQANQNQPGVLRNESPLQNDVVLRNLFQGLAGKELLRFRLVSRQWNGIAKPLLKTSDCWLLLDYNRPKNTYTKYWDSSKTLTQLNRILSTSSDFPVVKFTFYSGDLGCPAAQEFFTSHGEKIKELFLQLWNDSAVANAADTQIPHTRIRTLRKILLESTKNMEKLELFSIPKEWQEADALELFPEPRGTIQLSQITSLVLKKSNFITPKSHRLVQDIIQAAVNLRRIKGYKIEFFDPIASAFENKIHAVRKFLFNPEQENLDLYSKFGGGAPKLEVVKIPLGILHNSEVPWTTRKRVAEILQLILESSEETLEKIEGVLPIQLVPTLKLGRMQQITRVHFTDYRVGGGKQQDLVLLFDSDVQPPLINPPLNLDLAITFPNLYYIKFYFNSSRNFKACFSCFDSASENQQPLHSVKNLEISCVGLSRYPFLEKMTALFPALEHFSIFINLMHFQWTMSVIWKGFPKLQKLELRIWKNFEDEIITENLDAGICGFSPETCVQLRKNSRNVRFEDVEALREKPSICDATKLSTLVIRFQFSHSHLNQPIRRPFFSIVTGIFGFDLVRKKNGVKIRLQMLNKNDEIGLGEIAPYVDDVK